MGLWTHINRILLAKSFVLGTLVLVLWVRSYFAADAVSVQAGHKSTSLTSAKGMVIYRAAADGSDDLSIAKISRKYNSTDPDFAAFSLLRGMDVASNFGFGFQRVVSEGGLVVTTTIPHWFCFILVSAKAIFWLVRKKARTAIRDAGSMAAWCGRCQMDQHHQGGRCATCGSPVFQRAF